MAFVFSGFELFIGSSLRFPFRRFYSSSFLFGIKMILINTLDILDIRERMQPHFLNLPDLPVGQKAFLFFGRDPGFDVFEDLLFLGFAQTFDS
jgi:hypothetical protein